MLRDARQGRLASYPTVALTSVSRISVQSVISGSTGGSSTLGQRSYSNTSARYRYGAQSEVSPEDLGSDPTSDLACVKDLTHGGCNFAVGPVATPSSKGVRTRPRRFHLALTCRHRRSISGASASAESNSRTPGGLRRPFSRTKLVEWPFTSSRRLTLLQ